MLRFAVVPASLLAILTAVPAASQSPKPDTKTIARNLVTQSAGVKPGQKVLISGSPRDMDLMGDIAIETMKAGGQPVIAVWTEQLTRRSYLDVPAAYDDQSQTLDMGLVDLFDVQISVDIGESEGLLADVPPQRIATRSKRAVPVNEAFNHKGVRAVNLGNGLYPTATAAKRLGVTEVELARVFWAGVGASPTTLTTTGDKLRAAFTGGKQVTVTHPNGTNLNFGIAERPLYLSVGSLASQPVIPGTAPTTFLPAGEFAITPVPGSADGKVILDKVVWNGTDVIGLTLTFARGKLTGLTATSGLAPLKASYDAAGAGRDEFGLIDIGINPFVHLPVNTGQIVWVAQGAVTVGIGNNLFAGGSNSTGFGIAGQLGGATVKVDGNAVVESGAIK